MNLDQEFNNNKATIYSEILNHTFMRFVIVKRYYEINDLNMVAEEFYI